MAITDGLFALNINCICCAFGPGSIASRGLLLGAETTSRNSVSERVVLSGSALNRKLRPSISLQSGMPFPAEPSGGKFIPELTLRVGHAFR